MRPRVLVGFMPCQHAPTLSVETLEWARNIATILITRDESLTSEFVFKAGSLWDVTAPDYSVRAIYEVSISSDRPLDPDEELICAALQKIINAEKTLDGIREAIAYIAEFYQVMKKRQRFGQQRVTHRANLFINGNKITYRDREEIDREEIDIGVDRLAGDWALEMCECTTQARRFSLSKTGQIDFYAEAFRQIREVLDPRVQLIFELVAGYTTKRGFKDVTIPDVFKQSNVRVVGISLSTGQPYPLN